MNSLPPDFDVSRLDDGSGIENTLRKNNAKYHKHCYDKFQVVQVERAITKRKNDGLQNMSPIKSKLRSSFTAPKASTSMCIDTDDDEENIEEICFFCDNTDYRKNMYKTRALNSDTHVRRWATELRDTKYCVN